MIVSVIGNKNSGKSSFAEDYVCKIDGSRYYIATMRIKSDDDKARIEKHKASREGKDFVTIEQDVAIVRAIEKIKWMESLLGKADGKRTALIECLPTLVANEMFLDSGETVPHKDVENTILFGIAFLKEFFDNIVIVSDDEPDVAYYGGIDNVSEEAKNDYEEAMKELSAAIRNLSEKVYEGPF